MTREQIESVLRESGEKMWDNAVEACARFVEENQGVPADVIAAGLRRLTFAVTPAQPKPEGDDT